MSLCKNEKNQKGGQTEKNHPSYPCMKMKIEKEGQKKNLKKPKTSCPYAKMKKIKKRDGRKKTPKKIHSYHPHITINQTINQSVR
jgi:hypothetical protein